MRFLKQHKLHFFSLLRVQDLHPGDNVRRAEFCERISIKIQEDPQFLRKIIWTNESKFSKEGIITRRN